MGTGIQICGLNGCGKSTLGKALADRLGFYFIDNEDLYFTRTHSGEPYVHPRSREEAEALLMKAVSEHPNFVYAAVRGDHGKEIIPMYGYVVVIEVPKEIRSRRVRDRSFRKFGNRMLPGGDLYDQEEAFFRMAEARREDDATAWLRSVKCPIIWIDGTKPVEENVENTLRRINVAKCVEK